ncbi:MAG: MBL fold metallo-hydrolase [candidate division Zixibacteria bacterium]|nr:MBL fold metallo-hydrolase [candidate division Zixibacteria bacterium]
MSRCRITVLGSSSGMPSPTRFCSSFFFQTERLNFLIDCGEGVSFSFLRNKIDPELIDSIFITHSHVDHLGGLFLLVQMMHLLQRRTPLNVYLPEEAISGVKNFLQTCYLFPEKITPKLTLHPVTSNFKFQDEEISIKVYPNRHLLGNQVVIDELRFPNKMQSFCFLLNLSNRKIIYSGDIESSSDLTDIIQDADLLITECFHPRLEKLIPLMVEKKVKSAIFTHIPPELEGKEKEILKKAQKRGFEKLIMAYDGLVIDI